MTTMQSLRKAYGAIKDSTTVGLANINSDFKELDVAIVKATNHVECPPKERHIRKVLAATSINRPRADVAYCIHALARRLAKTHNWTVALKTLVVIHRTLREGDPTFREELVNFSQRGHILQLSNFKDDSSPIAWDCSAWVRTYALFLEERLECFRVLKYDVEAEGLKQPAQGTEKGHSRTRELDTEDLLEQLPALQQLLYRLLGCRPEGAAISNYIVQYALALVLKESFRIYCAINDGIINLVDKFFEMPRHEAIKALEIYRRAGQQAGSLSDFYEVCRGLELARNFQFPTLREPPHTFLDTMEEYIREAPRVVSVPREPLEFPERLLLTYKPEEASAAIEEEKPSLESEKPSLDEPKPMPSIPEVSPPHPPLLADTEDLLGLNTIYPDVSAIEESNALALSIIPYDVASADSATMQAKGYDPSGWELALVTAPSTISSATVQSQWGGGLDKLTLDSLYDEAAYRQQQQQYYGTPAPNPFMTPDPFAVSNQVVAPPAVQTQAMLPNPFFQPTPSLNPTNHMFNGGPGSENPFGDATGFGGFPSSNHHTQQSNPFGSPLL